MLLDRWRLFLLSLILVALGLGLRLLFLRHPNPIEGDPLLYANIARNLIVHGVYSFSSESVPVPTLIRLPEYPLFLAACFRLFGSFNFAAVRVVQILLDLVDCGVLAVLAGKLFGRRAYVMALGLACLCPFTANYTAAALTETLTLLSISVAYMGVELWRRALVREGTAWNGWLWVIGSALSASLLLRPEQGLLSVAVLPAVAVLLWQRGMAGDREPSSGAGVVGVLGPVCALLLCVMLPLVPWTLRNWRTFHVFEPLAPHYATDPGEPVPLGFQRWYRSWAIDFASTEEVYWSYDGSPILLSDLPARAFDSAAQYDETASLLSDYDETVTPSAEFDQRFAAIARERTVGHRLRYTVWLPLARLGNMLLRPRTELMNTQLAWWRWRESAGQAVFATCYAALNLAYLVAGVMGWWRWRARAVGDAWVLPWSMAGFVLLRCALLLTLDNSEPRYTLELFPLLIVCAAGLVRERVSASATGSGRGH